MWRKCFQPTRRSFLSHKTPTTCSSRCGISSPSESSTGTSAQEIRDQQRLRSQGASRSAPGGRRKATQPSTAVRSNSSAADRQTGGQSLPSGAAGLRSSRPQRQRTTGYEKQKVVPFPSALLGNFYSAL